MSGSTSAHDDEIDLDDALTVVMARVRPHIGEGRVADYIPELGRVDPARFGFAVATVDGRVHTVGDTDLRFSMQSITKVFTLALVTQKGDTRKGDTHIWERVHREPSGSAFNSLYQLEFENGIPRNPFINPGAIVVTDELLAETGDAFATLRELLRAETGNPDLDTDGVTAHSEQATGERNRALAHLMAGFGNMRNPVPETLDHYFRQCSITITATELARAGLLLARHGVRADGSRMLDRGAARRILAIMLTCGTYDAAGEFAYRVGLPCKSGVGGGILAVVPGRYSIAAWGPGLDAKGNSVTGALALDTFTQATNCSVF
ncbi:MULTISPECIES: glutaminase [unclassified Nocardiopsis]|uniref:glutaminase n=1 Tax=Nocardiopsis TaxID=2013 RepID=UPI00387AE7FF